MAAALMPQLAQTFVDHRSGGVFEMVAQSGGAVTSSSPRGGRGGAAAYYSSPRRQQVTLQKKVMGAKPSPSPKRRTPRGADGHGVDDVHSWTDQTLAANYTFIEEVGYGNWGSVWKVKPKQEGAEAPFRSVKLVHRSKNPTSSARVRALWQEYKAIRSVRSSPHPNLIDMSSFVITPSYAIITMSFHPRLMPVALSESRAKPYFRQLLSAVQHLHTHGLTHQDIKPSNILLSADDRPILIDFGFASTYSLHSPDRFLSSLSWGTPEYLSPERAKGTLHDERLSDVWALGVTMYEIVVGRTPFEQSEDENFLNREQLEVYYSRTLTGQFFGKYILSSDLESLIHLMVEPAVHLRIQSCAKALRHRFFEPSTSPFSARSAGSPPIVDTPTRGTGGNAATLVHTPSSKSKKAASPRRTPKTGEKKKGIVFYHDDSSDSLSVSPPIKTPFSPSGCALTDASNRKPAPSTPKPFTLKKTPPPSRIPIRKGDIGTPVPLVKTPRAGAVLGHRRLVSSPALSTPSSQNDVPPVPPLPSSVAGVVTRASSLKSVKRKPVPTFDESTIARVLSSQPVSAIEHDDSTEVLASDTSSPSALMKNNELESGSSDALPPLQGTPTFTHRSYTIKVGSKASGGVATQLRKLSVKHIRRAPSAMSFAGLKSSLSSVVPVRRRRASLADSVYSFLEPEKMEDQGSQTLPINIDAANPPAQIQRARLESFSRHIQHVMESRKEVVPAARSSIPPPSPSASPYSAPFAKPSMISARPTSPPVSTKPFSYNNTTALSPSPEVGSRVGSPPPMKSSLRLLNRSITGSFSSSPRSSPVPEVGSFKPGHRRIPTAIRSVPSILLFESADDGDYSELDHSRAETPLERITSPPPPPRVMEPSRQLPTWVPEDDSDDESDDADVDEPTVTIASPLKHRSKASRTSTMGRNTTPHSSPLKAKPHSPRRLKSATRQQEPPTRPPLTRDNTSTSASSSHSSIRPLPFQNFDVVAAPRDSTSTYSSSTRPFPSSPPPHRARQLEHKRSRSIMSFFMRSGTDAESRSVSRMSNTSSLGWSTSTEALGNTLPKKESREKVKKGGRLRAAVSRMFR